MWVREMEEFTFKIPQSMSGLDHLSQRIAKEIRGRLPGCSPTVRIAKRTQTVQVKFPHPLASEDRAVMVNLVEKYDPLAVWRRKWREASTDRDRLKLLAQMLGVEQ